MGHAEIPFKYFLYLFVLFCGFVDGINRFLTLCCILFQFSGQLYADFIRLSVSIDDPVYDVDHLVEDFLYNGISQ